MHVWAASHLLCDVLLRHGGVAHLDHVHVGQVGALDILGQLQCHLT